MLPQLQQHDSLLYYILNLIREMTYFSNNTARRIWLFLRPKPPFTTWFHSQFQQHRRKRQHVHEKDVRVQLLQLAEDSPIQYKSGTVYDLERDGHLFF